MEPQSLQLQIIGAGFGRTGTKSLKVALDLLGFHCYHMSECIEKGHQSKWVDAMDGMEHIFKYI